MILLGEWGFLDNLDDSSGNNRHSVFEDGGSGLGITYIDGPLANTRAIQFAHENQCINCGRTGLEPAVNGVTTMGWIRIPSVGSSQILSLVSKARAASSSRSRIGVFGSTTRVTYAARWADDLRFSESLTNQIGVNQWHHLALVDGPTKWGAYLDGSLIEGGVRSVGNAIWENFPWRIGRNSEIGDQWATNGMAISMVRVFDGELTQAEINTYKNTPVTLPPTGRVKVWNGTAWVSQVKAWNGTAWVPVKSWNGSTWG